MQSESTERMEIWEGHRGCSPLVWMADLGTWGREDSTLPCEWLLQAGTQGCLGSLVLLEVNILRCSLKWIESSETQGAQHGALWWPRWVAWEQEGGSRERGPIYNYDWFHVFVWWKPTQHCKTIILQLKQKSVVPNPTMCLDGGTCLKSRKVGNGALFLCAESKKDP